MMDRLIATTTITMVASSPDELQSSERRESLSKAEVSLFDYALSARPTHIVGKSVFSSFAWDGAHEHARDREGSSGPEAI